MYIHILINLHTYIQIQIAYIHVFKESQAAHLETFPMFQAHGSRCLVAVSISDFGKCDDQNSSTCTRFLQT